MRKAILFLFIFCNIAAAGAGTSGNEILKVGVGAKALAMGGSFAGLANNVDAAYYNPAGLVQVQNTELCLMHSEYLVDTRYEYLGFAMPLGKDFVSAISAVYLYNSFDRYDELGNASGSFLVYNLATTLSFGLTPFSKEMPELSIGLNLKYTYQVLDEYKQNSVFGDFGLLYVMSDMPELSFGLVLRNFGAALNEEKYAAPTSIKFGACYMLTALEQEPSGKRRPLSVASSKSPKKQVKTSLEDRTDGKDTFITLDVEKPFSGDISAGLGVELKAVEFASFRAGMMLRGADLSLTFGVGFFYEGFKLDYAMVSVKDLGMTHYPSLSYCF